ncbi:MAG: hypothetical protein DBX59_04425 [Bacillota bacterium]|nr:MAG: hypothetical protein DBX59_04425 [Bacillota bacterium]
MPAIKIFSCFRAKKTFLRKIHEKPLFYKRLLPAPRKRADKSRFPKGYLKSGNVFPFPIKKGVYR